MATNSALYRLLLHIDHFTQWFERDLSPVSTAACCRTIRLPERFKALGGVPRQLAESGVNLASGGSMNPALVRCLIFFSALGSILVGCNTKLNSSSSSEEYVYQFNDNGCDTGRKSFSSQGDMCSALKNDAANGFCARDLRSARFRQDCSGSMAALYTTPQTFDMHSEMVAGGKYSYQFSDNGCDTGEHVFSSKADFCAALTDEALNQGCAPALRLQHFQQACP